MKTALLSLAAFLVISGYARGVLVVNDSFDTYEDQQDFRDVWTTIGTGSSDTSIGSPNSAVLDIGFGASEPNSVRIPGTNDDGLYWNQLTFAATPLLNVGDELVWSFDYWDNAPDFRPFDNYATLQTVTSPDGSQPGQVLSLGLAGNQFQADSGGNFFMASISGHSQTTVDPDGGPNEDAVGVGNGVFFKLNDTGDGERAEPAGWRNLKLVISTDNGSTVNHQYYVDGELAETVSNVGPVLQYGVIRLGSGLSNGGRMARFDNMRLEYIQTAAVPEASAFAALGLVGLLFAGAVWVRKWRRALLRA